MNLINAINKVVNRQPHDTNTIKELREAQEMNKRANIVSIGQLQLRTLVASANTSTQVTKPMGEQRPTNLIEQLGIKYIGGLSSNFVYPIISGNNCKWEDETSQVDESNTAFSAITLQPRRLASYVEYSRDVVMNPSTQVAEAIQEDLLNSVISKVQSTMLNELYDSAHTMSISGYNDIVNLEYSAASKNISNAVYVVSPSAAKSLKTMTNGNSPILVNGKIDNCQVYETPSLSGDTIIFGDFSKVLIGQFGAYDVTIDNVTKAKDGIIRLTINSYWDFDKIDSNAFVFATTATEQAVADAEE